MSNELPEGLCKTMVSGGELIATSRFINLTKKLDTKLDTEKINQSIWSN